jgi:hypothetical protein
MPSVQDAQGSDTDAPRNNEFSRHARIPSGALRTGLERRLGHRAAWSGRSSGAGLGRVGGRSHVLGVGSVVWMGLPRRSVKCQPLS